ncbi:MAG TPA: helix-turn-helix domain-containing protein [Solirubrobacterales bacterium]
MQAKGNDEGTHPLRVAREDRDLSQGALAERAGVDRRTVIRTEQGTEPLVTTAIKLARGVGKRVEDLWGRGS